MFFISDAFAQTAAAPGGGLGDWLPIIIVVAIFWFLVMRPQMKKVKDHRSLVSSLKSGDEVVTAGGVVGIVSKVESDTGFSYIEIAENTQVKIRTQTISERLSEGKKAASGKKAVADKKKSKK